MDAENDTNWTCVNCLSVYTDADFRAAEFLCTKCGFTLLGAVEEIGTVETCLIEELWLAALDYFNEHEEDTPKSDTLENEIRQNALLPPAFEKFLENLGWVIERYDERTWLWTRIDRLGFQLSWKKKCPELALKLSKTE